MTDLLISVFESSNPAEARGQTPTAAELLDKGRQRVDAELVNQPHLRSRLQFTLAKVYRSLGDFETALPLMEQATRQIRQTEPGQDSLAQLLVATAELYWRKGAYQQAEIHAREAADICRRLGPEAAATAAESDSVLAEILASQGNYPAAEPLFQRALHQRRELFGANHPLVLTSTNNLAGFLFAKGDYPRAEDLMRGVLRSRIKLLGADHPLVAADSFNLATMRQSRGRLCRSRTAFSESPDFAPKTVRRRTSRDRRLP